MFCAAVPVVGALGAKLNAEQKQAAKTQTGPKSDKPIVAITTGVIAVLIVGSVVYHTTFFGRV
jgi:hypothetical protein